MYYIKVRATELITGKSGVMSFVAMGENPIVALTNGRLHFEDTYELGNIVDYKYVEGIEESTDVLLVLVP
jgi:hypothetical protein